MIIIQQLQQHQQNKQFLFGLKYTFLFALDPTLIKVFCFVFVVVGVFEINLTNFTLPKNKLANFQLNN